MNKRVTGSRYEDYAAAYLEEQGYEILEKNYRWRGGEIDLVGRDGGCLVFVEVKYRRDSRLGAPEEAVDSRKQRRIARTAACYLACRGLDSDTPCRFDVVAVEGKQVRLIRNAFGGWI